MATLSVKIYTVAGGRTPVLACGPNFNCPDPRDEFYMQNIVGRTMEAIAFASDGCRYTLYKINGGRGDASEACVFIPKSINAAFSPLMQIVGLLKQLIEQGVTSEEQKAKIRQLCEVSCPDMRNIVPTFGPQTGALHYGGQTGVQLQDILCDLFRPELGGFQMVFLSDQADLRFPNARAINANVLRHRNIVSVLPPAKNAKGFVPFIDGEPFDRRQEMYEGTPFCIEWERKYWHTITMWVEASQLMSPAACNPRPNAYKRTRNNPLYLFLIGIVLAIVIFAVASVTLSISKDHRQKSQDEQRIQQAIADLQFGDIDFNNIHEDCVADWKEVFAEAGAIEKTYDYSVHKTGNQYTPNDVKGFCCVVAAADYLATHATWERDKMEANDSLAGLFDFVNSYDIILAPGKGSAFILRFRNHGIEQFDGLLELKARPGLTGKCTPRNQISLGEYKIKVEGAPVQVPVAAPTSSKSSAETQRQGNQASNQTNDSQEHKKKTKKQLD